jgi:hypothetical protein
VKRHADLRRFRRSAGRARTALLRQGSFFGQTMKQPVSESSIVTRDMGAIIGLFALVAINRACIGSFVLGWW